MAHVSLCLFCVEEFSAHSTSGSLLDIEGRRDIFIVMNVTTTSSASIWDFQHSYWPSFSRISCRIKRTFKLSPCAARHGRISTPKPLIKIENKNISARGTINYCSALSHVLRTFRNRKGMKNYKSNRDSFVIAHMKRKYANEMKFDRAQ